MSYHSLDKDFGKGEWGVLSLPIQRWWDKGRGMSYHSLEKIVLFDLILNIPSTIFQLCRDGSSWVEPVLSKDECVLLKDTRH